jgi:hypothetical protein
MMKLQKMKKISIGTAVLGLILLMAIGMMDAQVALNSRTCDTCKVNAISVQNTQNQEAYFRQELNLSTRIKLKEATLMKLTREKDSDEINVKRVVNLARLAKEEKREIISEELLSIRKPFLQKLEEKAQKNSITRENVRNQLEKYIDAIEKKKQIRVSVTEDKVKEFFRTKNADELIKALISS